MRPPRLLLAALLCLAAGDGLLRAEEMADLASGNAVVTGTEEPERTRGLTAALADAIVKLTGDAGLAGDPRLAPLLARPDRFVRDLTLTDRMAGIPVHDEQGTRERPHDLVARFDAAGLSRELAALGIPTWSADRLTVAVRLRVETPAGAFVLARDGAAGYGQRLALVETAARRGLPIRLPKPSEAERLGAASSGAWMPDGANAALDGVLRLQDGGVWSIDWTLRSGSGPETWSLDGVSFDTAIRAGVEGAALRLSGGKR